ncbi:MAG: pilus assembly protein [Acidimicrobiia bacterium]|nr:pilus assembly protein [Acidimicrobiia bacterium]
MSRGRNRAGGSEGQAAVELALAMPLVALLLLAVVQLGFLCPRPGAGRARGAGGRSSGCGRQLQRCRPPGGGGVLGAGLRTADGQDERAGQPGEPRPGDGHLPGPDERPARGGTAERRRHALVGNHAS